MEQTLRTAASGMISQQRSMEITAHNIANINTVGYKRVRAEFQDLLYENLRATGGVLEFGAEPQNPLQVGRGTALAATTREFLQGDLTETGNPFDLAINGDGFFMVRLPDNTIAYTRDGSFKLNADGTIVSTHGYIMEPGITIPDDTQEIRIGRDGSVSVLRSGSTEAEVIGQIEIARFINPAGLKALGDNLYAETESSGRPIIASPGSNNAGLILQGYLEESNVELVEEMINMIQTQRGFELNAKVIRTTEDMMGTATNLKR